MSVSTLSSQSEAETKCKMKFFRIYVTLDVFSMIDIINRYIFCKNKTIITF